MPMAIGSRVVDRIHADHRASPTPPGTSAADAEQHQEQHDRHDPGRGDPADLRADDRPGPPVAADEDGGRGDDADAVDGEREVGQVAGVDVRERADARAGCRPAAGASWASIGPGTNRVASRPTRRQHGGDVGEGWPGVRDRGRPGNRASRTAPRIEGGERGADRREVGRDRADRGDRAGLAVEQDRERPQVGRRRHRQARQETDAPDRRGGSPDHEDRAHGQERRPEQEGPDGLLPRDRARHEHGGRPQGQPQGDHPEDPEQDDPAGLRHGHGTDVRGASFP